MSYIKAKETSGRDISDRHYRMQEMNDTAEPDKSNIFLEYIDAEKIFSVALSQHNIPSSYVQEALDTLNLICAWTGTKRKV